MAKQLRQDITGLRAIAVIAVTLYHVVHVFYPDATYLKGGFLGVDIFFVISGYLMTMIIMKGLERGNFSLVDFYCNRAKRICPALLVTIIIFLIIGLLLLGNSDVKKMSFEALYALGFVSNIYFALKTDYFGNSALDLVFLHTWSLSVEWQFYLFYPIILIALKRYFSLKNLARIILALTVFSAVFAAFYTAYYPRYAYYILPSRAFELLFGALAFFYPLAFFKEFLQKETVNQNNHSNSLNTILVIVSRYFALIKPVYAEASGLAIIALSLSFIDDSMGWPTLWALVPLFGTYLCIAANNEQTLLRNVFWQKIGLWSYAIYLVHWPILVFVTKLGFYAWSLEVLIPIVLIGMLLHYLVERRRNYGYLCLAIYSIIATFAFVVAEQGGATFRMSHSASRYAQYGGRSVPFEGDVNDIGDISRPLDFMLIGDSFARHYTLDLIDRGLHVRTVFRDGCYSFENYMSRRTEGYFDTKCINRYAQSLKSIECLSNKDLPIVFAQDWPRYKMNLVSRKTKEPIKAEELASAIQQDLASLAKALPTQNVFIIGTPRQTVYDIGSTCMYLQALDNPLSRFMSKYFTCVTNKDLNPIPLNDIIEQEVAKYQNFTYIDPNDAICIDGNCEILVDKYIPVYQDGLHYSWGGSVKVVSYILSRIGVEQGKVRVDFSEETAKAEEEAKKQAQDKQQNDSSTKEKENLSAVKLSDACNIDDIDEDVIPDSKQDENKQKPHQN